MGARYVAVTLLLVLSTLVQCACASELRPYPLYKQSTQQFVAISNGIHTIKIPANKLANTKIQNLTDGIAVFFNKEKHLSLDVLSREKLGIYDDAIKLSVVSEYLVAGKSDVPEQLQNNEKLYKDLSSLRIALIEKQIKPVKRGYLELEDGKAYIAIGESESVIYLYISQFPGFISQLSVHGMKPYEIEDTILQGFTQ